MPESFYEVLGVDRSLPSWKLQSQLHGVAAEALDAYGGNKDDLPEVIALALLVLTGDTKDFYDSLLEWSEEGSEVDFGEQEDDIREKAQSLHFELEKLPSGRVRVKNVGLKDPEPPPAPDSLKERFAGERIMEAREPEADPEPQHYDWRRADVLRFDPADTARYGLSGGSLPPLVLGNKEFRFGWRFNVRLISVSKLQDGAFNLTWGMPEPDGSETIFSCSNFFGGGYQEGMWHIDGRYTITTLNDHSSGLGFDVAFVPNYGHHKYPGLFTHSILSHFPLDVLWEYDRRTRMDGRDLYFRQYPSRNLYPQFFVGGSGWPRHLSPVLKKYLEEVIYWTRARADHYKTSPAEVRAIAEEYAAFVIQNWLGLSRAFLKWHGLPYKDAPKTPRL